MKNSNHRRAILDSDNMTAKQFTDWAAKSGFEYHSYYLNENGFVTCAVMATLEGRDAYWQLLCKTGEEVYVPD